MQSKSLHISVFALVLAALLAGCSQAPANFQKQLQEQLIKAKAGDVIAIPEGKFQLDRTLSLTSDKVTIRGQGMGSELLKYAIEYAKQKSFLRITLLTDRMSEGSLAFFEKHRFQRSDMIPMRLYLGAAADLRLPRNK